MLVSRAAFSVVGHTATRDPSASKTRTFITLGSRLRLHQLGSVVFTGLADGFRPLRLGSGAGSNLRAVDSSIGFGRSPDNQ